MTWKIPHWKKQKTKDKNKIHLSSWNWGPCELHTKSNVNCSSQKDKPLSPIFYIAIRGSWLNFPPCDKSQHFTLPLLHNKTRRAIIIISSWIVKAQCSLTTPQFYIFCAMTPSQEASGLLHYAEKAAYCSKIRDTARHPGILLAPPDAEADCPCCQEDWHQRHSARAPVECPDIRHARRRDWRSVLGWGRARLGRRLLEAASLQCAGSQVSSPEIQPKENTC